MALAVVPPSTTLGAPGDEPVVQGLGDGQCAPSSLVQALLRYQVPDVALDAIELTNKLQRRRRHRALAILGELEELATCVRHAAALGHATRP